MPWSWTVAVRSQGGLEGGHQVLIRSLLLVNGPRISSYRLRVCTTTAGMSWLLSYGPTTTQQQSGWLKRINQKKIKADCDLKLHQIAFCSPQLLLFSNIPTAARWGCWKRINKKIITLLFYLTSTLNIISCCCCSQHTFGLYHGSKTFLLLLLKSKGSLQRG